MPTISAGTGSRWCRTHETPRRGVQAQGGAAHDPPDRIPTRRERFGLSNARLEAVSNNIKTTIKMGYGYRSLDNLIGLVMLKCGGLNLKLPGCQ
nr:transposase [Bifidobacterium ramosum]